MNLYEINQAVLETIEKADPITGEIDLMAFEKLQIEKQEKQANIAKFILHLENDEAVLDKELERLKKLKEMNANRQEWLKSYLKTSMELDGQTKLDFPTLKVSIRKNPEKLVIDDEGLIPSKFIITKEVKSVAKDAIKLALAGGMEVQGCHLEQGTRLSIN